MPRPIRFHDLRHTTASLLLANGVGIKQVQAQLGHASAQITLDVYSHLIPGAGAPGADERQDAPTHGSQDVPEAVGSVTNVVAINGAR